MTAFILTTAGVITLITVAFCIVGGMADDCADPFAASGARIARARKRTHQPHRNGSDTSSGAVGDVIHDPLGTSTEQRNNG